MKFMRLKSMILPFMFCMLAVGAASAQDDAANKQLAKRLVQSASVKKGDVVIIRGGRHMIPLMEEIAIEVQMAGAFANMWLASDRVQRAIFVDQPEETLGQPSDFILEWFKKANVIIELPKFEDPIKLYDGVSPARLAKVGGEVKDRSKEMNSIPLRWVSINVPTESEAKFFKVDYSTLKEMTWKAINADYASISARAARLKTMLQAGKTVRVTTPSGTDFTFTLAPGRLIQVDDGVVTAEDAKSSLLLERFAGLPAGQVAVAPLETSANGKVFVAKDWGRNGLIRDTRFEFRNGKVVGYTAATNANTLIEEMAPFTGPKDIIGTFSIGLNPEMKVMDAGEELSFPQSAEGMVYVSIGDNKMLGGANAPTGFGGWGWPITNATVTVDGKVVVKDGKLII